MRYCLFGSTVTSLGRTYPLQKSEAFSACSSVIPALLNLSTTCSVVRLSKAFSVILCSLSLCLTPSVPCGHEGQCSSPGGFQAVTLYMHRKNKCLKKRKNASYVSKMFLKNVFSIFKHLFLNHKHQNVFIFPTINTFMCLLSVAGHKHLHVFFLTTHKSVYYLSQNMCFYLNTLIFFCVVNRACI